MNTLTALKRCALGLDLYLWLHLPHLRPPRSTAAHVAAGVPAVRLAPGQSQRQEHRSNVSPQHPTRAKEDQAGLAGVELHDRSGPPDPTSLPARHPTGRSRPATKLIGPFPTTQRPVSGLSAPGWVLGYPPHPWIVRSRKSPLSTGLCESRGFSRNKLHTKKPCSFE